MDSKENLSKYFQEWVELNSKVQEFFGQFDFSKIKEIRGKQNKIEDEIYEILKENAPENIKLTLPDDCGDLEVGYEKEEKIFYFVMVDSENSTEEQVKLNAITIDINKNISVIEDFEIEDSE